MTMQRLAALLLLTGGSALAQSLPQPVFAGIEPQSAQVNCPVVRYRVRVGEPISFLSFAKDRAGASTTSNLQPALGLGTSNFQFTIGSQTLPATNLVPRQLGGTVNDGAIYYLFNADPQVRSVQLSALSNFLEGVLPGTPVALATVNGGFAQRIAFTTNYPQIQAAASALPGLSGVNLAVFDSIGSAAQLLSVRSGSRNVVYFDNGALDTSSQVVRSGAAAIAALRNAGAVMWGGYPATSTASLSFFEQSTNATGGLAYAGTVQSGFQLLAFSAAQMISYYYEVEIRLQGGAVNALSFFQVSRTGPPSLQSNTFTADYCSLEAVCSLPTTGQVGVDYTGTLTARGGRAPFFWQALTTLPPGLTLANISTGLVQGRPTSPGSSSTTFRVSDSSNPPLQAQTVCNFTIAPPPLTATCETPVATAGVPYTGSINVVGGTNPYRFQFAQGRLPLDLILGGDTGAISGVPRETGTFPFTVTVTDSTRPSAGTVQTACSLIVNPGGVVTVTALDPNPINAGAPDTQVRVTGTGFIAGTRVRLDGVPVTATTVVSATQLTFSMTAAQLAAARNYAVDAITPDGRTAAASLTLRVIDPLRITALSPDRLPAGSPETILTIAGTGFVDGAVVRLDTTNLATAFRSATTLQAVLPADLLRTARVANITVRNPNAQVSNALTLTTTLAGPTLTAINPETVVAGTGNTQLALTGAGFVSGAVVLFGTASLATTFTSATALTAAIPAGSLATPGTVNVTVRNPDGQVSGPRPFVISLPPATVTVETAGQAPAVRLGSPAIVNLTGTAVLEFTPNASGLPGNYDNQQLVFANGSKTAAFTVAAGQALANLPAIQLGSVAGTVTVRVTTLNGQGQSVLPSPPPSATIPIARSAPVIEPGSVRISGDGATLTVTFIATSNSRDLTQAAVTFTSGSRIDAGGQLTVNLQAPGQAWFESADGRANGGSFRVTLPFNLAGGAASAITQVSVTLTNSVGTSAAVSGGR